MRDSIRAAVNAYAAGDAFGVAYEFEPQQKVIPNKLLGKDDWPAGGVSDDTLLSLMTIQSLSASSPVLAAEDFLKRLRAAAPNLRGLGPTTRAALGMPVQPEYANQVGNTNGGMMRTALFSLAFEDQTQRHLWVEASCRVTHSGASAIQAALDLSDLMAKVLEDPSTLETLNIVSPDRPVGLDPVETYQAVLAAAYRAPSIWVAFERACLFGGDTDTVCALSGALVALAWPDSLAELKWLPEVNWHEIPQLDACVDLLLEKRGLL